MPKRLLKLGVVIILLLLASNAVFARDESPYHLVYYEDENPNQLDNMLLEYNVCLEAVLKLNPGLDINNIAYGDRLRLPIDEQCYQYDKSGDYSRNFSDGYPPRLKYFEHGRWLDEPYYSDDDFYVRPTSLEDIAHQYNICVDDLLAENILLHDFERYKTYALLSLDVFIPEDAPPCDPDWIAPTASVATITIELPENDITPLFFVNHYNLCAEEIPALIGRNYFYWPASDNLTVAFNIPSKSRSCYNEAGQRLRFYDDSGHRLDVPVYSDLAVYIAAPGETLPAIAEKKGVCLIDLMRINHFPYMPLGIEMELFIPPPKPCSDDIEVRLIGGYSPDIVSISYDVNVCPENLLSLNPHFSRSHGTWYLDEGVYTGSGAGRWILMPKNAQPCYFRYHPHKGDSIFDLEHALNVCYEEFKDQIYGRIVQGDDITLNIRIDAPLCYNTSGQRLLYPSDFSILTDMQRPALHYTDMRLHIFNRADTVYSISQQYNVCVSDLLKANPMLIGVMPTGYPTFIPNARPCYDEATRMPLIYEDENGNPLPEPRVSNHLLYFGSQPIEHISRYFNVCSNRIEDANWRKERHVSDYLGWIIPTDRPPCYDADGAPIDYVCYTHPIDFHVDYSRDNQPIDFDIDGTYCYDLAQPETLVWHHNQPYKIVNYEDNILVNRTFMAWCFGVSLDEINNINEDPKILSILPFHARAIPVPRRDCYVQYPGVLDGHILHKVEPDETLSSIAKRYDIPYQWISLVNDLDSQNTIWMGQILIIPDGPTFKHFYFLIAEIAVIFASWLYWRRRSRSSTA